MLVRQVRRGTEAGEQGDTEVVDLDETELGGRTVALAVRNPSSEVGRAD